MKNIFKISCLFIATICVFALVKINPMPVYAQENALSISAIGVSSGTYATDNDSFNLPRNPDYGTFTFDDNVKEYLTDGDVTTFWENTGNFGRNPFNPDMSEYLVVDLGEIKKITGVSLMASNHGGFPEVLSCEYAVSNVDITYSVLNSTTRLEKAPETGAIQTVSFPGVVARYLYVNVQRAFKHTTYSQIHNVAIYDVCISDITLYGTTASDEEKTAALEKEQNRTITTPVIDDFIVDCSSVLDVKYSDGTFAYDPSNLLDGNLSTLWYNSFAATATEKAEEYITLQTADGSTADFREMTIYSQPSRDFFPRDFSIQYSFDGLNWVDIPGQVYTDYMDVEAEEWEKISGTKQLFVFDAPVIAKYLRISVTKKSPAYDAASGGDYWMIALSEIDVLACEVEDQNKEAEAEEAFWEIIKGATEKNETGEQIEIAPNSLFNGLFIGITALFAVVGAVFFVVMNFVKKEETANE